MSCKAGEITLTPNADSDFDKRFKNENVKAICVNKCLDGSSPLIQPISPSLTNPNNKNDNTISKYLTVSSTTLNDTPFLCAEPSSMSYQMDSKRDMLGRTVTCKNGALNTGSDMTCYYIPTHYRI